MCNQTKSNWEGISRDKQVPFWKIFKKKKEFKAKAIKLCPSVWRSCLDIIIAPLDDWRVQEIQR